jgi:TolB protein
MKKPDTDAVSLDPMNPTDLADLLAPLHASALHIADQGGDATAISAQLGIPVESVPGLLEMAAAKLARLAKERGKLGAILAALLVFALAPTVQAAVDGTDCGCTETGAYLLPDPGVRPAVGTIDATFSVITSPGGKYRLVRQGSNPQDPWRVERVSSGAVLHPGIVANNFTWSPDDDRLATNYQDASALQYFSLFDLTDLSVNGRARQIWTLGGTVWASARHRFSDDGSSYLFAGARNVNQITIHVVDVPTRATHAVGPLVAATLPADIDTDLPENFDAPSNPSIAGWGWGPDATRFVYSWRTGTSPDEFAQTLVNVRTGDAATRYQNYPSAKWGFSPCGDVFGIVFKRLFTDPGASALLYDTFAPSTIAIAPEFAFPFDTVELDTNATSHFGLLGGAETPITPNDADDACPVNQDPVAAFTPPVDPIAGQPAVFSDASTDSDGLIVSYDWDFGDGGTSSARNPSYTYAEPGQYTVTLIVTDDDGATATVTQDITVCGSLGPIAGKLLSGVGGGLNTGDLFAFDTLSLASARITSGAGLSNGFNGVARWSPDGTEIAVAASDSIEGGIYLMNADGSNRRPITSTGGVPRDFHVFPVWTPDGQWIAFYNDPGPGSATYMVRRDGTGLVRLPALDGRFIDDIGPTLSAGCASLAPTQRGIDCYTLFYLHGDASGQITIRSIRGDGTGQRVLIATPAYYTHVRVSPDGRKIAYAKFLGSNAGPKGPSTRIFVANITSNPVREPSAPISSGGDEYHEYPVWSPDGSQIAYVNDVIPNFGGGIADREIWVMDSGGCQAEALSARADAVEYALDWKPGSVVQGGGSVSGTLYRAQRTVQDPLVPLAGAVVQISGDASATTTTDANGRYSFGNLPIGANVTVQIVSFPNWVVQTPPYVFTGLVGAAPSNYFFALPDTATLSGRITETLGGGGFRALAGVTVRVEGPGGPYQATTDAAGNYSVTTRLQQSYTVTPSLAGYRFDPPALDVFTFGSTNPPYDFRASVPTPPGVVAFTSSRDGNDEIYVSELDGSFETNLTNDPASDVEPAVSPDGTRIAFASDRSGSFRIYTMNPDGSDVTELETFAGSGVPLEGREPAWSPDGARLAIATSAGLRVVTFDGNAPTVATSDPGDTSPSWDRNGTRLYFERPLLDGNASLVQVVIFEVDLSVEPSVETLLQSGGSDVFYGDPAAKPDGPGLAYTYDDLDPSGGSIVARDDATSTTNEFGGRDPAWSPDGQRIVGVFSGSENFLFWSEPDGLTPRIFTTSGADREPSWGPGSLEPHCGNGADDDGDGLADLDDPGCVDASDRSERGLEICDDAIDADGDGFAAFPQDPGCTDIYDFDERSETLVCDNGFDDDGDGLTDFPSDGGCANPLAPDELAECQDGFDNEGDGLVDTSDPTCGGDPNGRTESAACQSGLDDDGDGFTDFPDDPGCDEPNDASERGLLVCDDEIDADGDGYEAFPQDPGCSDVYDLDETSFRFACDDGIDNDGDGLTDMQDPGCPAPNASPENPQCNDGIDQDGDGLFDADDPDCSAGWPYWESRPAMCGLGAELPFVFAVLGLARRRLRRCLR